MKTGEALGELFAGGMDIESHSHPGTHFVTPNLTPDPTSGHITAFSTMPDDDLRALYRYLRTLPPVNTSNGPRGT